MKARITLFIIGILTTLAVIIVYSWPFAYRIGDCLIGPCMSVRLIGFIQYPRWTIAHRYMCRTLATKVQLDVLDDIVPREPNNEVIVHLRVGDVIDTHRRPVGTLWSEHTDSTTSKSPDGWEGYIRGRSYYQALLPAIRELGVSRVLIVAGSHENILGERSQEYIDIVSDFFTTNGFETSRRVTTDPDARRADDDFSLMCNCRVFLRSAGGYSKLAGLVAEKRGAVVMGF